MKLSSDFKTFSLAALFSLIVTIAGYVGMALESQYFDSVVYGLFAGGTLLYFDKTLKFRAFLVLLASSISLMAAIRLEHYFFPTVNTNSVPSVLNISLFGGAIIWVSLVLLLKKFNIRRFTIFTLSWFGVCAAVGFFGLFLIFAPFGYQLVTFVWQMLTLFLLLRLFSSLKNQTIVSVPNLS
jgi:hypothetical protein